MVTGSFSAELSQISLNDGSVISGELISINGGIYTIKSPSLGKIKIKSSDIKSIQNQANKINKNTKQQTPAIETNVLQQKLLGNEEIMSLIMSLQNDPNIQKALQNPELMKAINSGDITTLMNDPLIKEIMKNSTIQQVKNKSGIK